MKWLAILCVLLSVNVFAAEIRVVHKFGELVLTAPPQRIVSVGVSDQDDILAFGLKPLAVREWFGHQPYAVWPWAKDELGSAKPIVLGVSSLDYETIASLKPDLIIGVTSGMDEKEYKKLSAIAPTLAPTADYPDWAMPWFARHLIIGKALGFEEKAKSNIARLKALLKKAKIAHPEFSGKTANVAFYYNNQPGAYTSKDLRAKFLIDLGFSIPSEIDEIAGDAFYASFSEERLDLLNTDVLIWLGAEQQIEASSTAAFRQRMPFYQLKREYFADETIVGAFSFFSVLSIEYLITEMVPELSSVINNSKTQ
jgi:iron complex transport system substrate-binding protein